MPKVLMHIYKNHYPIMRVEVLRVGRPFLITGS